MKQKTNIYITAILFILISHLCIAKSGLMTVQNQVKGIDFIYSFFNRDCEEILCEIKAYDGDINKWHIGESNILVLSARYGVPEILEAILEKGGNPYLETFGAETPFDAAISSARLDNVKVLFKYASVNSLSKIIKLLEKSFDEYIMSLSILRLYNQNKTRINIEEATFKSEINKNNLLLEIIKFIIDKVKLNKKEINHLRNYFTNSANILLLENKTTETKQNVINEWNKIYKFIKK